METSVAYTYSQLLEISEKSYYRWKKQDHVKLLSLLEKYFSAADITEFLNDSKIEKFELIKNLTTDDLRSLLAKEIRINDIAPKLYKFNRRSLAYFYFLTSNKNINNLRELYDFIKQDITDVEQKSWLKIIKSVKINLANDLMSLSSYAREFKGSLDDIMSETELKFVFANDNNKNETKKIIEFIIENKLYSI